MLPLGFRFEVDAVLVAGVAHHKDCDRLERPLPDDAVSIRAAGVHRAERCPRECAKCRPPFETMLSYEFDQSTDAIVTRAERLRSAWGCDGGEEGGEQPVRVVQRREALVCHASRPRVYRINRGPGRRGHIELDLQAAGERHTPLGHTSPLLRVQDGRGAERRQPPVLVHVGRRAVDEQHHIDVRVRARRITSERPDQRRAANLRPAGAPSPDTVQELLDLGFSPR
jgi:hypothetical protein